MAANLLAAGYAVTVHNRSSRAVGELVARGARDGSSPAGVASASDVVITMLPDTPDVEAVLFGERGVAAGIAPGAVVVDMSTISPDATEELARRLAERGASMLDAPVSGGEPGAVAGTLAIMVGGPVQVFERCRPILEVLGGAVVHMGSAGAGQRTKLVNQVIGGLHLVALAEGVAFSRAMGLDAARVLDVVSRGAASSWMLANLGPLALAGDFAPGFTVHLQRKDLRLAHDAMRDLPVGFPGAELAFERFRAAEERGLGEQGTQGLLNLYLSGPARDATREDADPPPASWELSLAIKAFDSPDETRTFEKGRFDLVEIGGVMVGRASYEPGWRWSEDVRPLAGTDSCRVSHVGLVVSGRAKIAMDDGREVEVGPGDVFAVPPGHDSWVVGAEPYVSIHLVGADVYARAESAGGSAPKRS